MPRNACSWVRRIAVSLYSYTASCGKVIPDQVGAPGRPAEQGILWVGKSAVCDQNAWFAAVPSDSTALRVIDRLLARLRCLARSPIRLRERVWALTGPSDPVTIDADATSLEAMPRKKARPATMG